MSKNTNNLLDWLGKPAQLIFSVFLIATASVLALGIVTFVTQRGGSQALGESLEAEDATISSGPVKTFSDSAASNGKYVQFLTPAQRVLPTVAKTTCFSGINPTAGVLATTVTIHTTGNYHLWSRISSADNDNNSYWLQIDEQCPFLIGGFKQAPVNSWIWVDYHDGNPDAKLVVNLTSGSHILKLFGKGENLKLDRIILSSDKSCVPSDLGNNCK